MSRTPPRLLALLQEAREYPDEDAPRLVLGDWLQEHGAAEAERARGEFLHTTSLTPSPPATASPHLRSLTSLALVSEHLDEDSAKDLARWPHLGRLTSLDLSQNSIGLEGTRALARSPNLAGLAELNLSDNKIGNEGAVALAESPHLRGLTALYAAGNVLDKKGREVLRRRFGQEVLILKT